MIETKRSKHFFVNIAGQHFVGFTACLNWMEAIFVFLKYHFYSESRASQEFQTVNTCFKCWGIAKETCRQLTWCRGGLRNYCVLRRPNKKVTKPEGREQVESSFGRSTDVQTDSRWASVSTPANSRHNCVHTRFSVAPTATSLLVTRPTAAVPQADVSIWLLLHAAGRFVECFLDAMGPWVIAHV